MGCEVSVCTIPSPPTISSSCTNNSLVLTASCQQGTVSWDGYTTASITPTTANVVYTARCTIRVNVCQSSRTYTPLGYCFGGFGETVSAVLGKNKLTRTLNPKGIWCCRLLNWLDPGHVERAAGELIAVVIDYSLPLSSLPALVAYLKGLPRQLIH